MSEILILSTVDTPELARKISQALVEDRRAACVNIVSGVRSIYRWKDKICDDEELLLLIKTSGENFERVQEKILELHGYETPEVIALPITAGDADYLSWLRAQAAPEKGR